MCLFFFLFPPLEIISVEMAIKYDYWSIVHCPLVVPKYNLVFFLRGVSIFFPLRAGPCWLMGNIFLWYWYATLTVCLAQIDGTFWGFFWVAAQFVNRSLVVTQVNTRGGGCHRLISMEADGVQVDNGSTERGGGGGSLLYLQTSCHQWLNARWSAMLPPWGSGLVGGPRSQKIFKPAGQCSSLA